MSETNFTVGCITFEKGTGHCKHFRSVNYREMLQKLVEMAKKEKHSLEDTLSDVMLKWKGWDN